MLIISIITIINLSGVQEKFEQDRGMDGFFIDDLKLFGINEHP